MPETIGDRIPIDGNTKVDQGGWLRAMSRGTVLHGHDPVDFNALPQLWKPERQLLQVAPGYKWCSSCNEVRPQSYFDHDADQGDGYSKWCRACVNAHDPKQAKEKYCSACRVMHPIEDFAIDTRYADERFPSCKNAKKRYDAANHARKKWLNEGKLPGQWGGQRQARAAV